MKEAIYYVVFGVFVSVMTLVIHDARENAPVAVVQQEKTKTLDSVDLDPELQEWIFDTCEGRKISPFIVFAMIERESDCDPECQTLTSREDSVGLMQIQARWHQDRMDRLGVVDLADPKGNILVGVDYLTELFHKNPDTRWVLDAYNGGIGHANKMKELDFVTDYSKAVMERAKEMEDEWER